jgi:diguanylate cyclase (GGDEF)-like protein/PAS domain S-box-containing protein
MTSQLRFEATQFLMEAPAVDEAQVLALAIKGAGDAFWYWNFESKQGWFSERWFELLGYERSSINPTPEFWRDLIHPEDAAGARAALRSHLKDRKPYDIDYRCRLSDGSWRWMRSAAQAQWGDDGRATCIAGSMTDIERIKQAEYTSAITAARFRTLWQATTDGILVVDSDNTIQYANPAVSAMLGYALIDLQGKDLSVIQPERLRHAHGHGMQRYMATGQRRVDWRSSETMALHSSGREVPVELTFTELKNGKERSFVAFMRDISARREAEERARFLASHDPLTGLANRNAFEAAAQRLIDAAAATSGYVALMYIDLDRFKNVNDWIGHACGNELLTQVAQRFLMVLGSGDTLARQGGDEFLVLLGEAKRTEDTERVAQRLLESLAVPFDVNGLLVHIAASIGISEFPSHARLLPDLLAAADTAMYQAKAAGRNRARFYAADMGARAQHGTRLEQDLRVALDHGQLRLEFQPVYDVKRHALSGCEALLRWEHPQLGNVPPADFIHIAEASGLIVSIGGWVLREACMQLARWRKRWPQLQMSINISARQLVYGSLVQAVVDALSESHLPAHALILEITESALIDNPEEAAQVLHALHNYGVALSIDDFGTGFSSLSYLKRFPFTELKIDRSFVTDVITDPNDAAIVKAVIAMSNNLGLSVVAEGVETEAQAAYLARYGCQKMQGYFFGRPMPAKVFEVKVES